MIGSPEGKKIDQIRVTKLADSMPEIERWGAFDYGFGDEFYDGAMSVGAVKVQCARLIATFLERRESAAKRAQVEHGHFDGCSPNITPPFTEQRAPERECIPARSCRRKP